MKAEIRQVHHMPRIHIDGQDYSPLMFFTNTGIRSRFSSTGRHIGMAAEYGETDLLSVNTSLPVGEAEKDFSHAFDSLRLAVDNNPRARILLRVGMGVLRPYAWGRTHPDDVMQFDIAADVTNYETIGGEWVPVDTYITLASDEWLAEAVDTLRQFHEALQARPELMEHVVGYHIAGGETGEWFHHQLRERGVDRSPANQRGFRRYLEQRYGTPEAMNRAEGTAFAAFEEIGIPAPFPCNDRHGPFERTMLEKGDRLSALYGEYASELVADRILRLAAAAREITRRRLLLVFFYGYYFDLYDARTGHFALRRVLDCPDIDAFSSPICYTDRNEGGIGAHMCAVDSFALHGKLWLVENDIRTFMNIEDDDMDAALNMGHHVPSLRAVKDVYTREMGNMLIHATGCWYMDLIAKGWQYHPDIWEHIASLRRLYDSLLDSRRPLAAEVAVCVDERSAAAMASAEGLGMQVLYQFRLQFYRAGVKFGLYMVEDVEEGRVPSAKVIFLLDPFAMSAERMRKLEEVSRRQQAAIVAVHGFGHTDKEAFCALMDMQVEELPETATLSILPEPAFGLSGGVSAPYMTDQGEISGVAKELAAPVNPAYYVAEQGGEQVLARYSGGPLDGKAALAVKGRRAFFGGLSLTPEAIRRLCGLLGAHIYCDSGDAVSVGDDVAMLHAGAQAGERIIRLPEPRRVTDWESGRELGLCSEIRADYKPFQTRLFLLAAPSEL